MGYTIRRTIVTEPNLIERVATDLGVLMAEWGRHLDLTTAEPMAFWSVRVRLARPVDLCDPAVTRSLGLPEDPCWALDRALTRSVARELRGKGVDGLVVPSTAFLDQRDRGNIVVLLDDVADVTRFLDAPRRVGTWCPIRAAAAAD